MTLYTWILIAAVAGWPVMYGTGVWIGGLGHTDKCRDTWSIGESTAILEARQTGRHRVSQPRTAPYLPSPPSAASPPARPAPPQTPPGSGPPTPSRSRGATTAENIAPVIWTHQGTLIPLIPQAAPAKTGADYTGTLAAIRLSSGATTGEIRAIGDRGVARIQSAFAEIRDRVS